MPPTYLAHYVLSKTRNCSLKLMENQYHASLLESCTEDQWHDIEALYVTTEEAQLIIEAFKKILELRRQRAMWYNSGL